MKQKILVVDDEPDILEFMQYNLEKEGYEVEVASNGKLALEKLETYTPHLMILDIMMPEMDGTELCRTIRSDSKYDDILITFLTARSEDFSQVLGLDLGADDYITKPIRPRVLSSRISALLRRHKSSKEELDTIEVADLLINKEQFVVEKGGEEVILAKKEFLLLYLLASKPGKVFTRKEIFDSVWGDDVIVGNRTIDVHVRKVREKIGQDYIKTIKGIGYKFEF